MTENQRQQSCEVNDPNSRPDGSVLFEIFLHQFHHDPAQRPDISDTNVA